MTSRVDMHCHSTASHFSKLGVQRSLGLPECATPPQEVYELARRRGMDFVTITDHDTIDGRRAPGGPRPLLREQRSWERSMGQLAAGYRRALDAPAAARPQAVSRAA